MTVYEAGETEHGLFLAMRLVRGPTLKEEIQTGHARRRIAPCASSRRSPRRSTAAHEVGLIHRDVKPQNILVGARDHAYLADFGLTKVPDESGPLTGTGQFIGTIDYISPEQLRGEGASQRSDVYALAGVLYECLGGEVPYPRPTEAAVLFAHMSDPPPEPGRGAARPAGRARRGDRARHGEGSRRALRVRGRADARCGRACSARPTAETPPSRVATDDGQATRPAAAAPVPGDPTVARHAMTAAAGTAPAAAGTAPAAPVARPSARRPPAPSSSRVAPRSSSPSWRAS